MLLFVRHLRNVDDLLTLFFCPVLLIHPGFGDPHSQCPNARDYSDAFGHRDCAPGIENIEVVRALQAQIVGTQQRETRLFADDAIAVALLFMLT